MSHEDTDLPSATPLDLLINAIAGSTSTDSYLPLHSSHLHPSPPAHSGIHVQPTTNEEAYHRSLITEDGKNDTLDAPDATEDDMNIDGILTGTVSSDEGPSTTRYSHKRVRAERSPSPRQRKIAKTLAAHFFQTSDSVGTSVRDVGEGHWSSTSGPETGMSTVEVWHPTTGQKSYGKERRILAPPPILRVSGPLLPAISSLTLCTSSIPTSTTASIVSGSQTHRIADAESSFPEPSSRGKRAERQDQKRRLREAARTAGFGATLLMARSDVAGKEREVLMDGLGFPGLWIGEEVGKAKEFRLELKVSLENARSNIGTSDSFDAQPAIINDGKEEDRTAGYAQDPDQDRTADADRPGPFDSIDSANDLDAVLDSASLDVLQPLADAVRQANGPDTTIQEDSSFHQSGEVNGVVPDKGQDTDQAHSASMHHPNDGQMTGNDSSPSEPWATFSSSTLRIVSKPSQKTAKARSMASCFSSSASFALWTRIHAQTVRTKYMKLEIKTNEDANHDDRGTQARLTSKTGKWTPFKFEVIRRAIPPRPHVERSRNRPSNATDSDSEDKLTYGSIVALVDLQSGTRSDPVKIVKVESGEVRAGEDEGHPISELQRIGLVRVQTGEEGMTAGGRWYLSAPGARIGGADLSSNASDGRARSRVKVKPTAPTASFGAEEDSPGPLAPPETLDGLEAVALRGNTELLTEPPEEVSTESAPGSGLAEDTAISQADDKPSKKIKTKRHALAAAVLAEDEDGGSQSILTWVRAAREKRSVPVDPIGGKNIGERSATVEKVEDWMSWIIGGVSCFSYSFFPTSETASPLSSSTVDPIPRSLVPPAFYPEQNKLHLHLAEFFFPSSAPSSSSSSSSLPVMEPLDIYLGPLGPLYSTIWRSTAPRNIPTPAIPYNLDASTQPQEQRAAEGTGGDEVVMSSFPANQKHVIVVVHMPGAGEIIRTMQSLAVRSNQNGEDGNGEDDEMRPIGFEIDVTPNAAYQNGRGNDTNEETGKLKEADSAGRFESQYNVDGQAQNESPGLDPNAQAVDTSSLALAGSEELSSWLSDAPPQQTSSTSPVTLKEGPDNANLQDGSFTHQLPNFNPASSGPAGPDDLSIAAAIQVASEGLNDLHHLVPFEEPAQNRLLSGAESQSALEQRLEQGMGQAEEQEALRLGLDARMENGNIDPTLREPSPGPDEPSSVSADAGVNEGSEGSPSMQGVERSSQIADPVIVSADLHQGDGTDEALATAMMIDTNGSLSMNTGNLTQRSTTPRPEPISFHQRFQQSKTFRDGSLSGSERGKKQGEEMVALPLLLVRRTDGMVFKAGRKVVAHRFDGDNVPLGDDGLLDGVASGVPLETSRARARGEGDRDGRFAMHVGDNARMEDDFDGRPQVGSGYGDGGGEGAKTGSGSGSGSGPGFGYKPESGGGLSGSRVRWGLQVVEE